MPVGVVGCRLGPRVSRLGFPSGGGEAVAAASRWNKSSRTLPRPVGASLRQRRRARGGGTPCVECLFRSLRSAVLPLGVHRGEVGVNFCFQGWRGCFRVCGGVEDGSSSKTLWRRWLSTASFDLRPRELGARPQPTDLQRQLISFLGTSVFFGSAQSLCAMEFSWTSGRWCLFAAASGGERRRSLLAAMASTGTRGVVVIFALSRVLCASRVEKLSSVSYRAIPVSLHVHVRYP